MSQIRLLLACQQITFRMAGSNHGLAPGLPVGSVNYYRARSYIPVTVLI